MRKNGLFNDPVVEEEIEVEESDAARVEVDFDFNRDRAGLLWFPDPMRPRRGADVNPTRPFVPGVS